MLSCADGQIKLTRMSHLQCVPLLQCTLTIEYKISNLFWPFKLKVYTDITLLVIKIVTVGREENNKILLIVYVQQSRNKT